MLKSNLIKGGIIALLGVGALQIGRNILNDAEYERTRREVQLLIDNDSNGVITNDEWAAVYRELGIKSRYAYDFTEFGNNLTTKQLRQYLNSRKRGPQ